MSAITDNKERAIVNYYDLSEAWQAVARSNDDDFEDLNYIEPLPEHVPGTHILLDLSECMRTPGTPYDGVISCSNSTAIGVKFVDDSFDAVVLTYLG